MLDIKSGIKKLARNDALFGAVIGTLAGIVVATVLFVWMVE